MVVDGAILERRWLSVENHEQETDPKSSLNNGKKFSHFLNTPIVSNVLSTLISTAIIGVIAFGYAKITSIAEIPARLTALEARIEIIEDTLGIGTEGGQNVYTPEADTAKPPKNVDAPKKDTTETPQSIPDAVPLTFVIPSVQTESCIGDIIYTTDCSVSSTQYAAPPRVQVTNPIGYVGETQEECSVEQMADQKLLLNYMDGERRVFFYGQFDKDGYWTGNCVINAYADEKLALIVDAEYDHGKLLTFEQAFPNEAERQDGQDVWFFSKRTMKEDFSVGETWDYIRDGDVEQSFSTDSVTADDILTADELREKVAGRLEGYYSGNTSGGLFNDATGDAYMVKYLEDGTVRTLYKGKFENGFPEDAKDGWMIGRFTTEDDYSHYAGPFKKGHPEVSSDAPNAEDYWEIGISEERIDELLEGKTFGCELLWSLPRI